MSEPSEQASAGGELEAAHAAALDAYVRFSEASNTVLDPAALMALATEMHARSIPDDNAANFAGGIYLIEDSLWKLRADTGHIAEASLAVARAGLPLDTVPMAQAAQERRALFVEYDAAASGIPGSERYQVTGMYPLFRQGQVVGCLGFAMTGWSLLSEREKLVFLALGRALQLALERAWHAQEREGRLAELERRNRALETFAELSRDLAFESDPELFIREAEQLLFALLPGAQAQYIAAAPQGWALRSSLEGPAQPPEWDILPGPDAATVVLAPARLTERQPVRVGGEVVGVLEATLPDSLDWTGAEGAVLETVAYQLGLALERVEQGAALKGQRQALEDRAQQERAAREEAEAFSEAVWRQLRREVEGQPEGGRLDALKARLDALLSHARLTRRPLHPIPLSLLALALEVKAELERQGPPRPLDWRVHDLPEVLADREALRSVLKELFSNALTATRTRPEARIEVWSEATPQGLTVYVRDNGEGFEPQRAERLFRPEPQGRGLGLATVRQLIERHGGRVWAEGRPGQGATFVFTLP